MYLNNYNCSLSQFTILQFVRKYTCLVKKYDWNWFKEKNPRFFLTRSLFVLPEEKFIETITIFLIQWFIIGNLTSFIWKSPWRLPIFFLLFSFGHCNAKSLNFWWYLYIAASFNWQKKRDVSNKNYWYFFLF